MAIELSHAFSPNSQLAQRLIEQGARKIEREMEGITDDVVNEVNRIIRSEFDNSRDGFRSKGGPHLLGSIEAEVTSVPGRFPVTVSVWSTNDDQAKVASLESGSVGHFIFHGDSDFLYFPSNRVKRKGRRKGSGSILGLSSQAGGPSPFAKGGTSSRGGSSKQLAKLLNVHHPGNRPHHFLRRGLDSVVRRRLGQG